MFPALLAYVLPLLASSVRAATTCNGHAELCDRLYSNVTYIGTHDSYAVGSSIADNQDKDVTAQLNDGVRALQLQTHNAADGIHVCHTSCSLVDGGTLESYLAKVAAWVSSNPNDVVTIVMVNIENLPPSAYTSAFTNSGLSTHTYSPPSASLSLFSWPTLGTMIDAGTTVVVFMDNSADFASVPYLIDEFSNMWEDPYDVTTTEWSCAANRSSGNPGGTMMLVNHFLDLTYTLGGTQLFVPDKANIMTTNGATSISQHVTNCQSIWGRNPNIILLDYYDSNGSAPFELAASLNAVAAPTSTIPAGTVGATAASSTSASGPSATQSQAQASISSSRLSGAERVWVGGQGVWLGVVGVVLGILGGGLVCGF